MVKGMVKQKFFFNFFWGNANRTVKVMGEGMVKQKIIFFQFF